MIPAEIRRVLNTCNIACLAVLPRTRPVAEEALEVLGQLWSAVGIAQGDDDLRNQRRLGEETLRQTHVHVAAPLVDDVVAATEDRSSGSSSCAARRCLMSVTAVANLELHFVGEERAEDQAVGPHAVVIDLSFDDLLAQRRGAQLLVEVDALKVDDLALQAPARGNVALHDGRAGDHVGKLPGHAHEFVGVGDPLVVFTPLLAAEYRLPSLEVSKFV